MRRLAFALALATLLGGCVSGTVARLDDEGQRLAVPETFTHRAQQGEGSGVFGTASVTVTLSYPGALNATTLADAETRALAYAGWTVQHAPATTSVDATRNGIRVHCDTGVPHVAPMPDATRPDEDLMRCVLTAA